MHAAYQELDRLAWWLGHRYANLWEGRLVVLSAEDIHAELMLEVVHALRVYPNLSVQDVTNVARRCMYNRMKELLHREYTVHAANLEPLSDLLNIQHVDATNLELHELLHGLSPMARTVAHVLLEGSDRLSFVLSLANMRRRHVHRAGRYTLRIKPWMVARAIGVPVRVVQRAWQELRAAIKNKTREV